MIIPFAIPHPKKMRTIGQYKPQGCVIHFTAGRSKEGLTNALNTIEDGIEQGYAYLCIASTGELVQAHPLDQWGYHCGKSYYPNLGDSLSSKLIGIEVCCAGSLTCVDSNKSLYSSWFKEVYEGDEVRSVTKLHNRAAGVYHKFTEAQEIRLTETIMWLAQNIPTFKIEYVLGHDEVSPGRKNDPGGSLSMTMPEYRAYLQKLLTGV